MARTPLPGLFPLYCKDHPEHAFLGWFKDEYYRTVWNAVLLHCLRTYVRNIADYVQVLYVVLVYNSGCFQ